MGCMCNFKIMLSLPISANKFTHNIFGNKSSKGVILIENSKVLLWTVGLRHQIHKQFPNTVMFILEVGVLGNIKWSLD